ncbi:MAG: TolC family protein [Pirellulaceae bacterium]|nr:TolC family protein [Pirellulaceae bacterium]
MNWLLACLLATISATFVAAGQGCARFMAPEPVAPAGPYLQPFATEIEYPDVAEAFAQEVQSQEPRALENPAEQEIYELTLEEAIHTALSNNEVIRQLGAAVAQAPGATTVYDAALAESDPNGGIEGALSAFDAQLATSWYWNQIDRPINQTFPGLFLPSFNQFNSAFVAEVSKTSALGSRFALKHHANYDRNNNPSNRFPSAYTIDYEAEWRQPLLQGAGLEFNRIAGPNGQPGSAGGVLIARINTDISLADLEAAVIQLVSDVEQAYWELYFANQDLATKITARESALTTWRNIGERLRLNVRGGSPENEAQLRAQYYLFHAQVQDALSGDAGLYAREEQLRLLMGLPPNDGRLLKATTDPQFAPLVYNWTEILGEASRRRVELRRQKWQVKRRELEMSAAKNHLLPRLDAVGLYRWRGFGDTLIGPRGASGLANAYQLLTAGDYQEWQMGVELSVPIGYRRASAGLRNAELRLARENAVLREQQLRVSHELSAAVRRAQRAHELIQVNFNRRVASEYEVEAIKAAMDVGNVGIEVLLQAERRLADSKSAYHRSLVDYNLALRDVHLRKGSLLDFNRVLLSEDAWLDSAHADSHNRSRNFLWRHHPSRQPPPISRGAVEQHELTPAEPTTTPPAATPPAATPPTATPPTAPDPVIIDP